MDWDPQRAGGPPTPSSMSSGNSGGSSARAEKTPNFKQLSPSPSVAALSKISDAELRMRGLDDLVRMVRQVEADYKSLLGDHGNVVKEVNRRLQIFVLETRSLRENGNKLQEDNQELRDLCCFLDDDRQRGRKLAREWQRFGRYTASVMRSEVAVYQEKLKQLEERQSELVSENMDLKELCLYLNQERLRSQGDRDDGDGSSNGTITGMEDGTALGETSGSITPTPTSSAGNYPTTPSSTASYIKELELKVQRLEEEKKHLAKRITEGSVEDFIKTHDSLDGGRENDSTLLSHSRNDSVLASSVPGSSSLMRKSPMTSKPEAVVHAMKVLEVHEELEKSATEEDLDAPEKAIVREMCNVVWRKLGDVGDVGSLNESSDSILDSPLPAQQMPGGSADQPSGPSAAAAPPGLLHGRAHSYSLVQPQPQMASTPLASASQPARTGGNFRPDPKTGGSLDQGNFRPDPKIGGSMDQGNFRSNPATGGGYDQGNFASSLLPQADELSPGSRPPAISQQHLRHQTPLHLDTHQLPPTSSLTGHRQDLPKDEFRYPGGPQGMHPSHRQTTEVDSKPSLPHPPHQQHHHQQQHQHPPTSFPQYQQQPRQNLPPTQPDSGSSSSRAFPSSSDPQRAPSPTKSVSEHPPFSHPNFQHHQPVRPGQPANQTPSSFAPTPSARASTRHSDQRPHQFHTHQHQGSTASQRGGGSGVPTTHQQHLPHQDSYPNPTPHQQRPSNPHHQQQSLNPNPHHHPNPTPHHQHPNPNPHYHPSPTPHHQPPNNPRAVVRLLGAPGQRGAADQSRPVAGAGGGGQGFQRAAPGGPPVTSQPPTGHRPRPGPGDAGHENRGMLYGREQAAAANPQSSDPQRPAAPGYSHDGLRASGFRAYPPQPGGGWGGAGPRPTSVTDRVGAKPGQPPAPGSQRGGAPPNFQAPPTAGRPRPEQEWRQTYLDDSDTL